MAMLNTLILLSNALVNVQVSKNDRVASIKY